MSSGTGATVGSSAEDGVNTLLSARDPVYSSLSQSSVIGKTSSAQLSVTHTQHTFLCYFILPDNIVFLIENLYRKYIVIY